MKIRLALAVVALWGCSATPTPPPPPAAPPPPVARTPEPGPPPKVAQADKPAPPPPAPTPVAADPKPAPAAPREPPKPPPKVAVAPKLAPPKPTPAPAPAPVTAKPAPLDLKSLEQRLKETDAIGIMTKLSLKNQVDDLVDRFRTFHAGKRPPTLTELRPAFELLLMKVLSLLQDHDTGLARDIDASREAIWGVLADRDKFTQLSS